MSIVYVFLFISLQVGCTGPLRQWVTQKNEGTNFMANRQQDTADFLSCLFSSIRAEFPEERIVDLFNFFGCSLIEEFECASSITSNCEISHAPPLLYPDILPVPAAGSESILESINLLCSHRQIRERTCPDNNCNGEIAYSTTSFGTLPHVLIMQLQRFASENNQEVKLSHTIDVPIELKPNTEGPTYTLTGAVVHYGNTTSSGHFVSIVRCPHSGTLYRCSDSQVPVKIQKNEEEQTLNQAYMVLYSRSEETLEFATEVAKSPVKKRRRITGHKSDVGEMLTNQETHKDFDKVLPTHQDRSCIQDKDLSMKNPSTMERPELMEYCMTFFPSKNHEQNIERLREDVFCYMFEQHSENLTNEEITSMLIKCNAKPNKNKPKRIKQLFQIFKCSDDKFEFLTGVMKKESIRTKNGVDLADNESLPTPPYTTTTDCGLAEQETEVEPLPAQKGGQGSVQEDSFGKESTLQTDLNNDSLPTPPYTTTTGHGLADQETEVDTLPAQEGEQSFIQEESLRQESSLQNDLDNETRQYPDFSTMARPAILEYCTVNFPSVSKQQNIEKLRSTVYNKVFSTLIKGLGEKQLRELFQKLDIKANLKKENLCGQLSQYFKRNKSKKNTIINYLANINSPHINTEMTGLPDIENMTRDMILEYCQENVPTVKPNKETSQLRSTVFNHVFSSILQTVDGNQLETILRYYGMEPDNHKPRRKGQLKSFFQKSDCRTKILNFVQQSSHNQIFDEPVHTSSYTNNFFPSNIAEIMENKKKLKAIRQERVKDLLNGTFSLTSEIQPNPIFEAGKEMCRELNDISWGECITCEERWPGMETGPRSQKCKRCANERLPPGVPATFSRLNDMHPGVQPECLRILNTVEVAAISLICPMLCIYKLRGGGSGLRGHSVSFPQDVQQFVNRLPRRPEDLPYIVFKAPNQSIPLTANRHHIYNALVFLKQSNPDYAKIVIDMENVSQYPVDSSTPVQNIPTIDSEPCLSDVNAVPATEENPPIIDSHADQDTDEMVETVAQCGVQTSAMYDQIRRVLVPDQQRSSQQQPTIDWPPRDNQPASEWEPGFFSKSFPNLFPYGTADITKPRIGKKPEFMAYIRHLSRLADNRFAKDHRFLLHVTSMHMRHKALTLGNVYASKVCKDMTMRELKAKVDEEDDTIMKSLVTFASQIPGTKGFFSQESKKAVAMERWIRIMSAGDEMFNVFLTFSLPDIHIEELHRLLPNSDRYLGKIVVPKLTDIPPDADASLYIDETTDYLLRSRALSENGHIVDWFAHMKLSLLVNKVLHKTLGMVDYIIRSEYQSRSAVHWHMAGRMLGLSMSDIQKACKKYDFDVKDNLEEDMTEAEIEQERRAFLKEGVIMDHPNTEAFKQEVQESRDKVIEFTVLDLGLSACHPQMDPKLWPGPEGQNISKPTTNCLRKTFMDVQDVDQDYEMLVNRVQRHMCRLLYCLKKFLDSHRCRFGYPLTLMGFIEKILEGERGRQIWEEVVRSDDFPLGAGFEYGKLRIVRNHPKIVMHVPELLVLWRGNIDQKLIDNPKQFLKYALKYLLKPEVGSLAFSDIIKTLTTNADDNAPVRKVFQKILLKLVGEHDMSKNEAWRIVSGGSYVTHSRPYRYLNLTGSRRVNIEANQNEDQPAVARNFCDIYWAKESDENYKVFVEKFESGQISYMLHPKDVSLYNFASCFTHKWHPSYELHVPKPTPCFTFVPIPDNVEYRKAYCETTLLLHKPGTSPGNLLNKHEDVEEAMFDFASNDEQCPVVIKEEYFASLRMTAAELANVHNNVEDLVQSENSQTVNLEQEDWMVGLGDVVRQTDIMDPEPDTMDDDEDCMDIEMDETVDWSSDRKLLNLSNQQVDDAGDWIERMKVSADLDYDPLQAVPPESLNNDQRPVFDEMMASLADNQSQKLIDVSGGAGTGKSYLIKAILQKAQELSGHRNLVKIVSPTGSAASHFPDGQTIHSLLKIPAHKGTNELDDLTGSQLASIQHELKHTRAIIIDEKGMVGLGRLSQIHARLKQAKPEAADLPFGGVTILLAGDLRQLHPVGDLPFYSQKGGELIHQQGRVLYKLFDAQTFILRQQMRQQGAENQLFRDQLERYNCFGTFGYTQFNIQIGYWRIFNI